MQHTHFRNQEIKDRNIDELLGIAKGILADGIANEQEINFIFSWIQQHFSQEQQSQYPLNILYNRINEALSDGKIDDTEVQEITELLKKFTGGEPINDQVKTMSSSLPLCSPEPDVEIQNNSFCFTGAFTIGTRKACQNLIEELGGTFNKTPTLKTDYLVIGILGNEDWIHSSYGRKIEKAVENRDVKETGISIITEEHFVKFL